MNTTVTCLSNGRYSFLRDSHRNHTHPLLMRDLSRFILVDSRVLRRSRAGDWISISSEHLEGGGENEKEAASFGLRVYDHIPLMRNACKVVTSGIDSPLFPSHTCGTCCRLLPVHLLPQSVATACSVACDMKQHSCVWSSRPLAHNRCVAADRGVSSSCHSMGNQSSR